MKKAQNHQKNSLIEAHTATKRKGLMVLFIFISLFLVGTVSGADWDNKLTYSNNDLKVNISNSFLLLFKTSGIGTAELKSHSSVNEVKKVGAGNQVVMWYDFNFRGLYENGLGGVEFIDVKTGEEIDRDYSFVYWGEKEEDIYGQGKCFLSINGTQTCESIVIGKEVYNDWLPYNSKDIPKGNIRIGLRTYVEVGDYIDGVWTIAGKKVKKHATWTEALNVGLISYYNFEEASGDLIDQHDGNNGTNDGADYQATGIIDYGWDFELDNTDFVDLGNSFSFDDELAISFWFKTESLTANADLISKYAGADFIIYIDTNDKIYFTTFTPAQDLISHTHGDLVGNWVHVVAVYNSTDILLYVNGTLEASAAATGSIDITATNLEIGRRPGGTVYFDGIIDEVGIWNRTLTSAEVTQLWNGGAGISYISITPPTSTLNAPANLSIFTNPNIIFNATGVDNSVLQNMSLIVNGSYISTNSSPINNTLTQFPYTLPSTSYYNWTVEACDNEDSCVNATLRGVSYSNFIENSMTYNTTTLETDTETFYSNITTNSSTISTAQLNYNGTNYSATITNIAGNVYNISKTIDIPITTGNKSFNFNFLLGGILQTTTNNNQSVNLTNFTHFSAGTPFINISFKNETLAEELVDAVIDSDWYYWLGAGGVVKTLSFTNASENAYYTFLLIDVNRTLNTNVSLTYSNSISQQRNYVDSDLELTNTTTDLTLYLLPTADGIYVTFQVISIAEQPIAGVFSNVTRAGVLISSGLTDDSGAIAYFLDPDRSYTFAFEKAGYEIYTTTLTPTQTTYTITLGQEAEAPDDDFTRGINYSFSPGITTLTNGTLTFFNFSLTSSYWDVGSFGFNLTNQDGATVNTTSAATNGGSVYVYHNTSNDTSLTMTYYWIITGNITSGSFSWVVFDGTGSGFGLTTFSNRIITYLGEGIFGINTNSMVILIYLIIFVSVGIMSLKFGIRSPATITMVLFGLSFLFEVHLELIPHISGVPLLTTIIGIIVVTSLIREYLKI